MIKYYSYFLILIFFVQFSSTTKLKSKTTVCYGKPNYTTVTYSIKQRTYCPPFSEDGKRIGLWSKNSYELCCYFNL